MHNAAPAFALALAMLAGCASAPAPSSRSTAMAMDTTREDFEHLWNYEQAAESEARFRAALTEAPGGSEDESQLLTQLARTHSLRRNFAEAHRLLDRVEPRLATSSAKIAIRYALERGRTFNSTGGDENKRRAKALFESAWERASAAGLDFYAIDAAHMLAIVTAAPAEQHAWNRKALAVAERTPDARAKKWLVSLYNNIGWTYHDEKRYDEALAMFEKALAAAEARGPDAAVAPLRIAKWTVGRCLRSLERHEEALARQIALRDDDTLGGASDGYVHEEIGENLLALNRPEEARLPFRRAFELLRDDPYLTANEPARLQRLQELGGAR
jgi:tetratricopeptide (TPR) repeat protein